MRRVGNLQPKTWFLQTPWGEKSLAALYVSVVSGIVVSLQYDPAAPFYSISAMEVLIPFGNFWRSLHFYSSQLFFLLTILHFLAIAVTRPGGMSQSHWIKLVLGVVVALLLLFTGYVLRGDATGEYAGTIAENIILSIPVLGTTCNDLLFAITTDGLKRVYANHLIGLGVVWGIFSWHHLRRYNVRWQLQYPLVLLIVAACAVWPAPLEPEHLGQLFVPGPWFMLGLQELLRYLPPFWAGIVFPSSLVTALCLLQSASCRRGSIIFIGGWIGLYTLLSLIGWSRGLAG